MLTKTHGNKAKPDKSVPTMSSGTALIEFRSPAMIVAFAEGLETYRPTLNGERLKRYIGEGPSGLAEIAEELGFGDDLRDKVIGHPRHQEGVLFCKPDVLPRPWTRSKAKPSAK